ncbi:CAP-Gly domain-containing linker protein 1-like [Drosophila tropicalis]|uniref:CAP-Gly domain-containing linker protein 1-like n=1 Tax=Drosophila tropicalis TaxID=46794 RepID=UPI0035AB6CDA
MDQAIINLMLWNTDASREDSASEANSMIDGFELMNTQCEGNCYQKVKSILQQAADTIKLKDQQIDNHMKTISMMSMKSLEIHKHYVENQMPEKSKEVSDLVSKYQDQLKESIALLKETNERQKNLETQKEQVENQLADQTKAREDQLNARLELSNERLRMLQLEKEQVENQLTVKVYENEILIQNYEKQINNLKDQIMAQAPAPEEQNKDKDTEQLVWIPGFGPMPVTIQNNLEGYDWMVICRNEENRGKFHLKIDIELERLYHLTKDFEQELYIQFDKNKFIYHHITEFAMYGKSDGYQVKTLKLDPQKMTNYLPIDGNIYDVIDGWFGSDPYTVMMRYNPKSSIEKCSNSKTAPKMYFMNR